MMVDSNDSPILSSVVNAKKQQQHQLLTDNNNYEDNDDSNISSLKSIWKQLESEKTLPISNRFDFAYDTISSYTFIYGGTTSNWKTSNEFWLFHHESNTFQQIHPTTNNKDQKQQQQWPTSVKDASAVICGNAFYLIGGMNNEKQVVEQFWKYNITKRIWTNESLTSMIEKNHNTSNHYENHKQTFTQNEIIGRAGHSLLCYDNKIIILFGGTLKNGDFSNDIYTYQVDTKVWTKIEPTRSMLKPLPRMYTPIITSENNKELYLFGGYVKNDSNTFNSDDLWKFSFEERVWTRIVKNNNNGSWPPARSGNNIFKYRKDVFYIFGGEGIDTIGLNDIWQFNYRTNVWKKIENSNEENSEIIPIRLGSGLFPITESGDDGNSLRFYVMSGVSGWENTKIYRDLWTCEIKEF
ncbi:hypothetical protein ABK040_009779 [Willaertia magna]